MEMKNKLYRHHKSKASLLLKELSFVTLGVCGAFAVVAVPTYISSVANQKVVTQASEENPNENKVNNSNENNPSESEENPSSQEEELLAYE